jgi:hypothetical protein
MHDIAGRCAQLRDSLVAKKEAGDDSVTISLCVDIHTEFLRVVSNRDFKIDHAAFSQLVDLLKAMESLMGLNGVLSLGSRLMTRRPQRPPEDETNWPAQANDSTPKVIELFALLARHAKAGSSSFSNQNVLHLMREVLAQHASHMTVEEMKPFLDQSRDLTWACKVATSVNGEDTRPAWVYFDKQDVLQEIATTETLPNQAWTGLLQHYFPFGMGDMKPESILAGGLGRGLPRDFDRFALKVIEIGQAGIKIPMHRTDVVLVSQMLERMTLVVSKEANTPRAQHYVEAITALVAITVPVLDKINDKTSLFAVTGKNNPMAKSTLYNQYTLEALKSTVTPLAYPEAAQALEHFRFQVLLHTVAMSETFHKKNEYYRDKEHLQELSDLCAQSLIEPKPLAAITPAARLILVREMSEGPARRKLMTDDMKIRKVLFIEDLGM